MVFLNQLRRQQSVNRRLQQIVIQAVTKRQNPQPSVSSTPFASFATFTHYTLHSSSNNITQNQHPQTLWKSPPHTIQQKRSMFIQTSTTPNPESLKFLPGRPVLTNNNNNPNDPESDPETETNDTITGFYVTAKDKTEISKSPLCTKIFQTVDGVKAIYLGSDFITITKYAEYKWTHLQPPIFAAIMDFYSTAPPGTIPQAVHSQPIVTDTTILDDDDEVVAMIKELLETRIRPAVQEDGGDIHYVTYEEDSGIVYVKLAGSCVGCPSSSVTLKNGVENMLMHYIPEVSGVEAVMEEEEEGDEGEAGKTVEETEDEKKARTYEERLRAAGIPFSD